MRVSDLHIDRVYLNKLYRSSDYTMSRNHYHYYFEIFYVQQGMCRFFIENSLYELRAGDFLVIPPHVIHYNRYITGCTRYNLYFRTSDLKDFLQMSGMSELNDPKWFTETHLFHVPHAYRDTFSDHLDLMIKEDKLDDDITPQLLQLHLYQFFLYVHRWCRLLDDSSSSAAIDDPILEAARFISENYNQNISLDMLASRACLSSGYFSKRFRQVTGVGMKEYLTYVRLEHASQELLSTDHTITDVALNSGFADSNYFKDAFKKMYGASPRNFRKNRNTDSVMAASIARMQSGLPQK